MEELIKSFLEIYKQKVRLSSYYCTENVIKNYFLNFPKIRIDKIEIQELNKWFNNCKCSRNRKKRIYGVLKQLFEHADIYFGIRNIEYKKLIIPKEEVYEIKEKYVLSLNDFNMMIEDLEVDNIYYMLFMFAFICGLRISEVLGIKVHDIDFETKKFKLSHQYNDTIRGTPKEKYTQLKTINSLRDYVLPESFIKLLKEYINKNELKSENYLFKYCHEEVPISRTRVNLKLHEIQKKKGLSLFSFHAFRRSEASLLNEIGVSGDIIASYLGHDSFETTKEYYLGSTNRRKKEISEILEKKIFSKKSDK